MAEFVEGDWKGFNFQLIGPSELPQVCEHLESSFYMAEPLANKVRLSKSPEAITELNAFVAEMLEHKLSFWVREKSTGKIAGMRLTMSHEDFNWDELKANLKSPEILKMISFGASLDELCDVCREYGVETYAEFIIASVAREFRGQGLASEMYVRALRFVKASGFTVAKSSFTSPFTRRAAAKLGFRELARLYFRDWKGLDAVHVCPDAGDEEFGAVMTLGLDSISMS